MKRFISILLTLAMLLGIVPVSVFAENSSSGQSGLPFTDVPKGSWYEEYVQYVYMNGLFNGTSATEFAPDGTLTRAMFVTVLGRMDGIDTSDYSDKVFTDVAPDSWYGPYVAWAVEVGITNGMTADTFAPDREVTREQMSTFVYRYLSKKGITVETGELSYPDRDSISEYAVEAVGVCTAIGIFEGDENGNFKPQANATRAQAAAVFTRLHKYINAAIVTNYCKVTFAYPDQMDDALKESLEMEPYVMVEKGSLVYTLVMPDAAGYIFGGWYYDSALTELVAAEETVEGDMTLYPYLFKSEEGDEVVYQPNFTSALDVSAEEYYVTIIAKDEATLRNALFIHSVGEGDVKREPVITDNGDGTFKVVPEGGFIEGGTYQFKALDRIDESIPAEDYIHFAENGEDLGASVQFYNVTVAKAEYDELRLNDEIKFISIDGIEGFSFEDTALIDLNLTGKNITAEENNAAGSFEYHGSDISVGDIIAIHDGVVDAEKPNAENCEHVSYVRITGIDGNRYSYEIPDIDEVLFTPEVLPIPKEADEGVTLTENEDGTYTLAVYNEYLDYTKYSYPAVNAKTDADVGDFIALYNGKVLEESTVADYYEILGMEAGSAVTEMTLKVSSMDEITSSMGAYDRSYLDLTLTEDEINDLQAQIIEQAGESGFADETAKYIADMLANSGSSQIPEESACINVLDQDGNLISDTKGVEAEAGAYVYNVKLGKVDVEANITNHLQEINSIHGDIGVRVELAVQVPLDIEQVLIGGTTQNPGEWNTVLSSLHLDLTASFVQEFAIDTSFSADEDWDVWFIFPYISEINVNINLDVGTYTGVGIVVNMDTGAYDNAYDMDSFISAFDSTYDPGKIKIGNLAKTLEAMMNEPYKFFGDIGSDDSLLDDYREMMNQELEYVELLAIRLLKKDFYITPNIKIVHIQLIIEAVISAKASISIGASFEHLDVKRHSFQIKCIAGKATQNVTSLQNGYTNFNFFAMGNIGLRIGGRVTVKVGVFSVKIANLGLMLETGPCIQLYGFFYFHYDKHEGKAANMYHGGMYLIEIGWYLLFDFFGGAAMDMVGFNVHLVEEEWYFWRSGDGKFIVAPNKPEQSVKVGKGTRIDTRNCSYGGSVFSDATKLLEVDIKTGKKYLVSKNLSDFNIVCTNPAFELEITNGRVGMIWVTPPEDPSIQTLEGQFRLTYKHGKVPLSNTPIVSIINVVWTKTFPLGYIYFYDEDRNQIGRQECVEGTHPTNIQYPNYTPPAGYDWTGQWEYTVSGFDENGSYYRYDQIFDPETYVVKDFEFLYLYPVLTPRSDVPYKVHHFIESLEKPGTYELYQTDEKIGTAGDYRYNSDLISISGFYYNRERSGGGYYYDYYYQMELPCHANNRIEGDGSTVIEYYYDRLTYYVWLEAEPLDFRWYSELGCNTKYLHLRYGETVDASDFTSVELPGYTFAGWRNDNDPNGELVAQLPTVTQDMSYTAVWAPRSDTLYTVTHHIMQADGSYQAVLTQEMTGTTGELIDVKAIAASAVAENPELFHTVTFVYADDKGHYNTAQEYEIIGGGYTKLNLYYDREYYRAYWYGFGDYPIVSYFYEGQTVTAPEEIPEAPVGYQFSHWGGLTEETVMGTEHMYFSPVFEGQEGIAYTVIHVRQDGEYFYDVENKNFTETEIMYGKAGTAPTVNYKTYEGFTAVPYEAGETVIWGNGTLKVVVKYQRNRYSLTLETDGGSVNAMTFYHYGISYELPTPRREGYTFQYWYLKDDASETPVTYIDCYALTALTYVAKWQAIPIRYKVEHYLQELDGSYGEPRTITLTGIIDTEVTLQPSDFVGFTFDASNAMNVISGFISDEQGTIVDAQGNTVTLRLYYSRNTYTATWYDYDGSKLVQKDVLYGAAITLPEGTAEPQRTGYTFVQWKDFATMGTSDASFYAKTDCTWNANRYTVRFNANGGSGTMADQSFVYDTAQKLSANAFTYVNRNFKGWSTAPDGSAVYSNSQSVSNLTAQNGGVVTLYAVWELIEGATAQYTIEHYTENLEGGYSKYRQTTAYGAIEKELTLTAENAISIVGFTFDPTAENILTATVREDGSTVFKLCYSRNSYDLTLDFGGEQIKVAVMDEEYIRHIVTMDEDPERAIADQVICVRYGEDLSAYLPALNDEIGYTFAGWDNAVTTMPAEALLVTAQWEPVEVTVTFHPGTEWFFPSETDLAAEAVTMAYRYGEEITPPEGILEKFQSLHDGVYTEAGWIFGIYQSNFPTLAHFPLILVENYYDYNPTFRTIATDENGGYLYDEETGDYLYTDVYSVTVSPFWVSRYDVVLFDANGGEGEMPSMNVYSDGFRDLPVCTFTREGYVFVSWKDENGTTYGIYDCFYGNGYDATTTILYAQWEKIE